MNAPPTAPEIAGRLGLHRSRQGEWRGNCPACGYKEALVVTQDQGRTLTWCASCQDSKAVFQAVRAVVGSDMPPPAPTGPSPADNAARIEKARHLWAGATPAENTPAALYLARRRLPELAASPALRFRGDTSHPAGGRLPAMLARIDNAAGELIAVHRTYLRPDGSKAGVEPVKASLGPVQGGAIRLAPAGPELVVGEGIETAASAGHLIGLPAWAAISAGNLARSLVLPPGVRTVVIAADHDEPDPRTGRRPGQEAARAAAWRWRKEGRRVRVALPDRPGVDFNDMLTEAAHG